MSDFLTSHYLVLKSLHIIFMIFWMAALFYLPRLFLYHARVLPHSETSELFKIMERDIDKRQTVEEMMGITAFLRRPPIYLLLYGWCTERRDRLPDEDWKETIRQFKTRFNIPDEIECDEAMYLGVYRMTVDLINEGI